MEFFEIDNYDVRFYERQIKDFLPDRIIDCHVHLWLKDNVKIKKINSNNPFNDYDLFRGFTKEDYDIVINRIFEGKEYNSIFFGNPFPEMDINGVNKYLLELAKKGFRVLYIPDKDDFLENEIFKNFKNNTGFLGFKPYPKLSREDGEVSIFDFLNERVLEYANKNSKLIMLHLPREKRLADKNNINEIKIITKRYPRINFILAHAGRSYCISDIRDVISEIKDINNLIFGISFVNNWEVFEIVLKNIDIERIVYGSDMPAAILKGKNICINDKHYFITKKYFNWSISNENLDTNFTFFIYEQIKELFKALVKLNIFNDTIIDKIFFKNMNRLIKIS
jgi:hypothetical protein